MTFRQEPNRIFDFMSNTPESMHMLTWLFSPRGIPKNYRTQEGFGVNTYRMVNAAGKAVLVKYHWKSRQGIESLTAAQAAQIQAERARSTRPRTCTRPSRAGDFPQWELNIQIMSDDEHPELDFDPLDDTKTWPEDQFPLRPVGVMTLNRNVGDHHNENEQIAFGTGVLVDGLDFGDDKCSSAGPSRTPTPSATGLARTTCSCLSTARTRASWSAPTRAAGRYVRRGPPGRQPAH